MIGFFAVAALAVSSQVTDVTVYSDRALVTRTAEVELAQGMNTYTFGDLPESVDSRGIQVDGSGDAVVLDVRFKSENYQEIPKEEWKKLYDKQDALQRQEQGIVQQIERYRKAKVFLLQISDKVTHKAEKEGELDLNPESWEKMLLLYTDKNAEYDEGIRKAELELEELRKALKQVQADIRDAGADLRKKRRVVEVDLEAPAAGKAELKLSYIVRGPKWVPTYDVRVDTESREMEVKYFALVRQNTGEDWGNVALQLSTANPGLGGRHPELQPWRIQMMQPRSKSSGLYGSDSAASFSVGYNAYESSTVNSFQGDALAGDILLSAMEMPELTSREAEATRQGASVVFAVKGRSEIASDHVEHRVAVASVLMPSSFRYSAIPKADPHAYLKAKAANAGAHPLLEGKANIFLDGSFVTTSNMELVPPGEEFWVFLGADESIKVEHKLIKKYQSTEGFTGKDIRHSYEYLMTVKNTHGVPEEIIVWDQLPISGSEGLEVKLLVPKYSKDSDSLKMDDEKRISWFKTLEAGQEWQIPFSYYIEAPKNMTIDGLE